YRLGAGIGVRIATAHDGQRAVLGAGLAAGHRRVNELETALPGGRIELARDIGRRGRVIDERRALLHPGKRAIRAERDRTQIVVIADTAHHEVLALGRGLGRGRRLAAELPGPCQSLCRGAVIDRDLVATLLREVSCHRKTHHAETEKSDFSHVVTLGFWPSALSRRGGFWGVHHNPCAGEGNGFVWATDADLC